jgi:hypothetical protein
MASATAQAMLKSGAPSVNLSFSRQTLSALSELHPSVRVSIFIRLGLCDGNGWYKDTVCSSTYALLFCPRPSHIIRLFFLLPDQSAKICGTVFVVERCVGLV